MSIIKIIPADIRYILNRKYITNLFILAGIAMKKQYRESFLGTFWSLIQPAIHITILSIVFSQILLWDVKNYTMLLVSGLLPWTLIMGSFTSGSNILISRGHLFKSGCIMPKTMFIISEIMVNFYVFFISFITMYLIVGIFFTGINPNIIFWPIVIIPLLIFCVCGAVAFAYIAPYIRDTGHLITILLNALFWTVPIVYPITAVPENKRIFFELNPFYMIIKPVQDLVHGGHFPTMETMGAAFGVAAASALITLIVHKKLKRNVIYYL